MVGGLRALLLQALHPGAMAKLAEVSDVSSHPWERLQRTVDYVMTLSFGTCAEADAAAAHVRAVHRSLGVGDPEQMAYVHAAFVDSMLALARSAGITMAPGDEDRYVAEQVRAAELVGVPDDRIVGSVTELRSFLDEIRPRLRAIPQARSAAWLVLAMPLPAGWRYAVPARVGWTTLATLALGLLPRWARRMYLLPTPPGNYLATAVALRAARAAAAVLPLSRGPRGRIGRRRPPVA